MDLMILFLWISFTKKTLKSNFVSTENFCIFGDVLSNFGRTILDIWSSYCQLISYWRQNRIHSVDMLGDAIDLSFHLIGELHIFSGSNKSSEFIFWTLNSRYLEIFLLNVFPKQVFIQSKFDVGEKSRRIVFEWSLLCHHVGWERMRKSFTQKLPYFVTQSLKHQFGDRT